jgi:hypothetical protein
MAPAKVAKLDVIEEDGKRVLRAEIPGINPMTSRLRLRTTC